MQALKNPQVEPLSRSQTPSAKGRYYRGEMTRVMKEARQAGDSAEQKTSARSTRLSQTFHSDFDSLELKEALKPKAERPFIARLLFRELNHESDNMMKSVTPLDLDYSALNFWSLADSSKEGFCLAPPSNPLTIACHLFQRQ